MRYELTLANYSGGRDEAAPLPISPPPLPLARFGHGPPNGPRASGNGVLCTNCTTVRRLL